jgi:hypothetical protein
MSTLSKRSPIPRVIPRVDIKRIVRDLAVKKVIKELFYIWLMIIIGQYKIF